MTLDCIHAASKSRSFQNHLHASLLTICIPMSPFYVISSFFLHRFLLSPYLQTPPPSSIASSLPACHSPSEAYWFSTGAFFFFSTLSCQEKMGSSDVPNHDKQILCLLQNSLEYRAHTRKYVNAKQMGDRERWSGKRDTGREGGMICTPIHF